MIYLTQVEGERLEAQFLRVLRRPDSSQYYDYYYCCNSCGREVAWLVNGEHAAIHYTTSTIGSIDYETSDTSGRYYTSMILSKWKENESIAAWMWF